MGMTDEGWGPWLGRYLAIVGEKPRFHARNGGVNISWSDQWSAEQYDLSSELVSKDAGDLYERVVAAKTELGHRGGGSFLINEYGRVLVPRTNRRDDAPVKVWCAGTWEGPLTFVNPWTDERFDLYDDAGLKCGDHWHGPYIGMPHTLRGDDSIAIKVGNASSIYADRWQLANGGGPDELVQALRRVRRRGFARFISCVGGVVITKEAQAWRPIYVGRFNLTGWFGPEG